MQIDHGTRSWLVSRQRALPESDVCALAEVVGAIERIDAGTYGRCTGCGAMIAPLRLRVLPAAALCVSCAAT